MMLWLERSDKTGVGPTFQDKRVRILADLHAGIKRKSNPIPSRGVGAIRRRGVGSHGLTPLLLVLRAALG